MPVIFHNLKGYRSNLIMQGIGKFYVKISFISNGLEKINCLIDANFIVL